MGVRVHQFLVALPLTLVSALGIAVTVQSLSLESADLLSVAPADTALPLDAIRGSVEGVVPPPPARPAELAPAPAVKGITGFAAPAGAATAVEAAPAPRVKAPAARTQRPKPPAAIPRSAPADSDCVPDDPTLRELPNPTGVRRPVPRQRSVSDNSSPETPLPGAVPARTSAGLPTSGSTIAGLHPSTSRPGPSTSGPGSSISQSNPSAHSESEPVRTPPRVTGCSSPGQGRPGSPARRRVPASEPVVARDGGLTTPARSGW